MFDCAMGERTIHYMGHVNMMAAVQPFISGAISKTVNMPESATVEEVENLFVEGWRLGLKALALYRDNCKVAQPLRANKKTPEAQVSTTGPEVRPERKRLPKSRPSRTISFRVGDAEGYMTAGSYPDDGLGELFLKVSKQGSTLSGVMDSLAIAVSIGLQYGVPLEAYIKKFMNMRFEPSGMTDDTDIRFANSIVDYIFRRLALEFLDENVRNDLGIRSIEERKEEVQAKYVDAPPAPVEQQQPLPVIQPPTTAETAAADTKNRTQIRFADAPYCYNCGNKMRPSGSCFVCESCGSTSGCS
ncbi:MAG: hypothetical protein NVSMB57_03640 [Actinomycetota bacterium]